MHYIILDLEWNQAPCAERTIRNPVPLTGEIIQFGAVKLDEQFQITDEFCEYVHPKYYTKIKREIAKLTGITKEQLDHGQVFPLVFYEFQLWCGEDSLLFTWGNDDLHMLKNNLIFHQMENEALPKAYDLQLIYGFQETEETAQHSLQSAMEHFGLQEEEDRPAHNALNDAYYTALVARQLNLKKGLEEYSSHLSVWMSHSSLRTERLSNFPDKIAALRTKEVRVVSCPICRKSLYTPKWISQGSSKKIVTASCPEHGMFLFRMTFQSMGRKGFDILRDSYAYDEELRSYYENRYQKWQARLQKRKNTAPE